MGNINGIVAINEFRRRRKSSQRQAKHRMNRHTTRMDRCNPGGGHNRELFARCFYKVLEEGGFPGAGPSGQKNTSVGMFY